MISSSKVYNNYKYICIQHQAPKYIKQPIELKGEIDRYTIIVGDFVLTFTMDRTSKEKINKDIVDLNKLYRTLELNSHI